MNNVNTDIFYVTVNTNELVEVIDMDCMPLVYYDEEKFEYIKSELVAKLGVNTTGEYIWIDKETYIYAKNDEYAVGVTDNTSNYPRIFVDTAETNSTVVINSLHSLVSLFGTSLLELPGTLEY